MWVEGVNIRGGQEGNAYNPGRQGVGDKPHGAVQPGMGLDWSGISDRASNNPSNKLFTLLTYK
jgi:hypothetical protein